MTEKNDYNYEKNFPFITKYIEGKNVTPSPKLINEGTFIYHEGDECSSIAFVINGSIRVAKTGMNGREVTLYRVNRGEACILTVSSILSKISYPATAIAETDTEVIILPVNQFRALMVSNTELQHYIYKLLSERLVDVLALVDAIIFRRMDERLIEFLVERSQHNEILEITHEEIAIELGSAREVVSRIMKEIEKEGLIHLSRGKVTLINRQKLEEKLLRV